VGRKPPALKSVVISWCTVPRFNNSHGKKCLKYIAVSMMTCLLISRCPIIVLVKFHERLTVCWVNFFMSKTGKPQCHKIYRKLRIKQI